MSPLDPSFIIKRGGKDFVLYAGLLDMAHGRGLREIDTEPLQLPSPENGNVAIVKAIVILEEADDYSPVKAEREKRFSGIGDACPENVGKNIVPHIIRMAETRAKARALRDAVNVGIAAAEELGAEDADSFQPSGAPLLRAELRALLDDRGLSFAEFEANHGVAIDDLTDQRLRGAIQYVKQLERN